MEKLSFFSLRKSIFQLLHPINHWLCWSRAGVTGPRRDPDISGDDVNINIAPAAALYLISAGAGLHNQELHKQQPSPGSCCGQARGSSNHSVITAAVCRASLALAARLARPSLGCTL